MCLREREGDTHTHTVTHFHTVIGSHDVTALGDDNTS